jgi:ATP-dependent DNA helicase RecG
MDAHSRRQAALDAIKAVLSGTLAGDAETEIVDFKEEEGTVDRSGGRVPISPRDEPAARALAAEVACLAMSDDGGILVVGVNDRDAGPSAFVGSYLDLVWLRRRIHALTQPNLALDVFEERTEAGARIYLINVQPALEEVRVGGKLRTRHGTDCIELSGDRAREFLERRRRYDWSAEPSDLRLSQADPEALKRAHELYRAARGRRAGSDLDLAGKLAVALDDSDNPSLNRAGALLVCPYEQDVEQLDVRVVRVEGANSTVREILKAPLVRSFDEAWAVIDTAFVENSIVVGATRRSVRAIPEEALREALVNAIMHRDYRTPRTPIVALTIGDPAITLKVTSPGDFPPGVDGSRLLAARSEPRNRALADAMRLLGYAEREGNGIPTMFRVLLRDGHPEPEIYSEGGDIICRLPGGQVDTDVRRFFDQLYIRDQDLAENVRAHIAVIELLASTPLRVERLSDRAQCSEGEAFEILETLAADGVVERLLDGSRSFRFTSSARQSLQSRIKYSRRRSLDQAWDLIRAYLDVDRSIGRNDAARLLDVTEVQASRILSRLYNDREVLKPVGSARGRGVRYELARGDSARRR